MTSPDRTVSVGGYRSRLARIMDTDVQFCPLHKTGYNSTLDPVCPQCTLAHIAPPPPLNYDVVAQKPIDAAGNHLNKRTLQPEKNVA